MATAFDGLGMQFMGKERQHMASGPFGELAKMIAPGALAYGLYKSGAVDSLNSAFNPKEALMGYMKGDGQGVAPPQMSGTTNDMLAKANRDNNLTPSMVNTQNNVGVPPTQQEPMVPSRTIDNDVDEVIPMQSVSADPFKRDVSQDMAALQTTQAPAPPPSNVGQGQMGKDAKNDGGVDMASIVKLLMAFA
jgi:hypothetical protein